MPRKASPTLVERAPATAADSYAYPTRPDPKVRWVWALRGLGYGLLTFLFLAFGPLLGILADVNGDGGGLLTYVVIGAAGYVVLFFLLAVVYAFLATPRYSFEVRDEEVIVRRGILFRTTSRIPLRKVQDIHVKQGPLLRAFGLASVKLETAGGSGMRWGSWGAMAEGQLPGLRDGEAVAAALSARVKALRSDL